MANNYCQQHWFNQERKSTCKGGIFFLKLYWLNRSDPFGFGLLEFCLNKLCPVWYIVVILAVSSGSSPKAAIFFYLSLISIQGALPFDDENLRNLLEKVSSCHAYCSVVIQYNNVICLHVIHTIIGNNSVLINRKKKPGSSCISFCGGSSRAIF